MLWFNKYPFAHCAMYGTSLALINEDLTGMALFAGALISAGLCGLVGAGVAAVFYDDVGLGVYDNLWIGIDIIGYYLLVCMFC